MQSLCRQIFLDISTTYSNKAREKIIIGNPKMTQFNQTALLKRQDVTKMTWQRLALDSLSAGQVRLDLNVFSLTTNNVTYAVMGEGMLGYWNFFRTFKT